MDLEDLPVAEEIGQSFLTRAQHDLQLVMPEPLVFRKEHDDIFKCRLPAGQPVRGGE